MEPKYKRILLKISGEALAGEKKTGLDYSIILSLCESIKKCVDIGVEIGIVVGGGNFWRGRSSGAMDRTRADHIGMLATVMNCIYVSEIFRYVGGQPKMPRRADNTGEHGNDRPFQDLMPQQHLDTAAGFLFRLVHSVADHAVLFKQGHGRKEDHTHCRHDAAAGGKSRLPGVHHYR